MTGFPDIHRVEITHNNQKVLSTLPVSSLYTWNPAANASNWLNGTGAMYVPATSVRTPMGDIDLDLDPIDFLHFRVVTRAQPIARLWIIQATAVNSDTTANFSVGLGSSGFQPVAVFSPFFQFISFIEPVASQSVGLIDLTLKIESRVHDNPIPSGGGAIKITNVICSELWRPSLEENFTDNGTNVPSVGPRERIYVGPDASPQSVAGVYRRAVDSDARRVGIYHFVLPERNPSTATGTPVDLTVLPVPVLMRKIKKGAITGPVFWSAYAKVSAGTGTIAVTTTHSGVSDSTTITNGAYAWTEPRQIDIDCEDMAVDDGRQASSWDELMGTISCSGGTISLASLSVWDGTSPVGGDSLIITDTGDYIVTETGERLFALI